jgi:hypothetical protein
MLHPHSVYTFCPFSGSTIFRLGIWQTCYGLRRLWSSWPCNASRLKPVWQNMPVWSALKTDIQMIHETGSFWSLKLSPISNSASFNGAVRLLPKARKNAFDWRDDTLCTLEEPKLASSGFWTYSPTVSNQ